MRLLLNTSRSKDNQARKFSKLMEYTMRTFFLEKSYVKCGGETSARPFSKKIKTKLSIYLYQWPKALLTLYLLQYTKGLSQYIKTKLQTSCYCLI